MAASSSASGSRFTVSHNGLTTLQSLLDARQVRQPFGQSQSHYGGSKLGAGATALDKSTTLRKLEALRAVAAHAQANELSMAMRTWADLAATVESSAAAGASHHQAAERSPVPRHGAIALVSASEVAGPASGQLRQAAAGRRTLRLLESLRAVVQSAPSAERTVADAFAQWRELPPPPSSRQPGSRQAWPHERDGAERGADGSDSWPRASPQRHPSARPPASVGKPSPLELPQSPAAPAAAAAAAAAASSSAAAASAPSSEADGAGGRVKPPRLALPPRLSLSLLAYGAQNSERAPTARMGGESARGDRTPRAESDRGDATPRGGDATPRSGDATPRSHRTAAAEAMGEMEAMEEDEEEEREENEASGGRHVRGGFGASALGRRATAAGGGGCSSARGWKDSQQTSTADFHSSAEASRGSTAAAAAVEAAARACAHGGGSSSSSVFGGSSGALGGGSVGPGGPMPSFEVPPLDEGGGGLVSVALADLNTLMTSVTTDYHRLPLMTTDGPRRPQHADDVGYH